MIRTKALAGVLATLAFTSGATALAVSHDYIHNADEIRARYAALYRMQTETQADGSIKFDKGRLFKRGGINVLYLKGDAFEMGYQHGRLLKEDVKNGLIPKAAQLVYNEVNAMYGHTPVIRNTIYRWIDRNLTTELLDRALERAPGAMRERSLNSVFGISEGSGVPVNTFLDAALNPSVLMLLANRTTDGVTPNGEGLVGLGAGGASANCSEFAVKGPLSEDGEMLIGRNTDYPLTGVYDDHHTVIYFDPTIAGTQRYMSIISAGVHNAGVAAFNASGLYLGSHTIPSTEVATDAVPAFFIANEIMAKARTFDEAVEIFRSRRAESGWTYVLYSAAEKRLASVEINAKGVSVRPMVGDWHVQSNHYLTPEKQGQDLFINQSIKDDSHGRYARLEQLITGHQGPIDLAAAAAFMADQQDPYSNRVTGLGNTVSVMTTVTSIVAQPARNRVFVASGRAPVPHSTYVEVPLPAAFDPDTFATRAFDTIVNDGYGREHPEKLAALRRFIEAKEAYEYRHDVAQAETILQDVVRRDPENIRYKLLLGLMKLKRNDFTGAEALFQAIIAGDDADLHTKDVAVYLRGRIRADANDKNAARRDFRLVLDSERTDGKLKDAAQNGLNELDRIFRYKLDPAKLSAMFQFGDLQNYK